jgi:predicted ATPase
VLELHRRLLRGAFAAHGGYEVDEEGDALFVVFAGASDAVAAAADGQQALAEAEWPEGCDPLRVRMGVHTGEPLVVPPKYVGMDVHQAARIMSAGHGGQVLVSETTAGLLDRVALRDLGPHRLKDLRKPIQLFQLELEGLPGEFPPLKSLNRTNLPVTAGSLLGRERQLAALVELLSSHRLLTLTGPGGTGKTRLAVQVAAEASDEFPDGVFFVSLAPLGDDGLVEGAIATAVGALPDEDLFDALAMKRALLVLDNAEHLEISGVVDHLLDAARDVVVLVTSRRPLHLSVEREVPIPPLDRDAAVELFITRAAAAGVDVSGDETVAEICQRLDCLPLAVELAASRTKLLSSQALLSRLGQALPVLTGGPRDAPERQQTLRATIGWSYQLLDEAGRLAFRRLAVFHGGVGLEAAEEIAGVDLEMLGMLVDNSLLKRIADEDRVLMLETIREFALERLAEGGEEASTAETHARWYLHQLREFENPRLGWYEREAGNLWAALDVLSDRDRDEALAFASEMARYWVALNRMREGRAWLQRTLGEGGPPSPARARALAGLGDLADRLGDSAEAETTCWQAVEMARTVEDDRALAWALCVLTFLRNQAKEHVQAQPLAEEAVAAAARTGERRLIMMARTELAATFLYLGKLDSSERLFQSILDAYRDSADHWNVWITLTNLAEVAIERGNYREAQRLSTRALELLTSEGQGDSAAAPLVARALASLALNDLDAARHDYASALELTTQAGQDLMALECVGGIAASSAQANPETATTAWSAYLACLSRRGLPPNKRLHGLGDPQLASVREQLGAASATAAETHGESFTDEQAIALARSLTRPRSQKP